MVEATEAQRRPATPIRSAIEIALLAGYLFLVPQWLETAVVKSGIEVSGYVQVAGITVLDIGFFLLAWAILKSRGERLQSVGLKRPKSIVLAVAFGLVMAALGFAAVEWLIRSGIWTRSPGYVPPGQGGLLGAWIGFEIFVPGPVEEFVYRGVLMDRIAKAFGSSRGAWAIALVLQAVVFSLAHGYNGVIGLELGAGFGLVYGLMFFLSGRNLWPLIIFHGAYDTARVAYAYWLQSHG